MRTHMDDRANTQWYAGIERGRAYGRNEDTDGKTKYTVESYDRPGVVARNIPCFASADVEEGSMVYFFMFPDGKGGIVGCIT